ncbi:MAG: trypsin-like peptidase domain-containing protein [Clostridia bacterium]|nr:trypsin-like peptidase domain-containing protein [Clostridia bacterium]
MKKNAFIIFACILLFLLLFSCSRECEHSWGEWKQHSAPTCEAEGSQVRVCDKCQAEETGAVEKTAHTLESSTGKYNTCTKAGTRSGKCSVCKETVSVTVDAREYSSEEIKERAESFVCEIVTYDRAGKKLASNAGVVNSAGGKILTSFRAIDGAYSAKVKLAGKSYEVDKVEFYSEDKDLAVLSIDERTPSYAVVCSLSLDAGSTVYSIGLGGDIAEGKVAGEQKTGSVKYIAFDVHQKETSGVLFNAYGEVVGIKAEQGAQDGSLAVSVGELDDGMKVASKTVSDFYFMNNKSYEKLTAAIKRDAQQRIESEYQLLRTVGDVIFAIIYDSTKDSVYLIWDRLDEKTELALMMTFVRTETLEFEYVDAVLAELDQTKRLKGSVQADEVKSDMAYTGGTSNFPVTDAHRKRCNEIIYDSIKLLGEYVEQNVTDVSMADLGFSSLD